MGVLAVLFVGHAIALLIWYPSSAGKMAGNICLRTGLTLGAIWLAYPQIVAIAGKWPPRLIIAILVGALIVIARPKSFPLVLVLVAVVGAVEAFGALLKSPPQNRPRSKSKGRR
jgi:hypothetical protein